MEFNSEKIDGEIAGYGEIAEELVKGGFRNDSSLQFGVVNCLGFTIHNQCECDSTAVKTQDNGHGKTVGNQLPCYQADGRGCLMSQDVTEATNQSCFSIGDGKLNGHARSLAESSELSLSAAHRLPSAVGPAKISRKVRYQISKQYCEACEEIIFSKNMAKHKKSKRHIRRSLILRSGESEHPPIRTPTVRVLPVPESEVKKFLPPDVFNKLAHALLEYGYKLAE